MLLCITRHPKGIAWFFLVLFYAQWVLAPLPALAGGYNRIYYNGNHALSGNTGGNPLLRPLHAARPTLPAAGLSGREKHQMPVIALAPVADMPFSGGPGQ